MTPEQLNAAKYELEMRRFRFDRAKAKQEHRFLFRNSAVLITAALSAATIGVSIASAINSVQSTRQNATNQRENTQRRDTEEHEKTTRESAETERKASFDLLQYITANYDLIYSQATAKQVRIRNSMELAFPKPALDRAFAQLAETAPTKDGPNVWQKDLQEQDSASLAGQASIVVGGNSAHVALPVTSQEAITALTGPRRRLVVEEIAKPNNKETRDLLISTLLPQSNRWSYRFNLYTAVALAQVPKGWSGTSPQYARVIALKQSGNYADPTFKKWVDAALHNYTGNGA